MRPVKLWILTVLSFVVLMVFGFVIGRVARRIRSDSVLVQHSDPELDVAIETARRELPGFIRKLQERDPDVVSYAVKARFVDGKQVEMMWVDHLTYASGVFSGTVADAPLVVSHPKKGELVHVPVADVVDWLIIHHRASGNLQEGGETTRVLRRRQRYGSLRYPPRMPTSTLRIA